jgi:hypothetical protein
MATSLNIPETSESSPLRGWTLFAAKAYAKIIARKHDIAVPDIDVFESLSDEELSQRLRLLSELAHLPPA